MKVFKIILHSFVLAFINVVSVLFGFGIYHFLMDYNQLIVQIPVSAVFSVIVFTTWIVILKYKDVIKFLPESRIEFFLILLFSLTWLPVIFIPLHYLTRGYITFFGNIYMTWLFQIPVNIFIVLIAYLIISTGSNKKK